MGAQLSSQQLKEKIENDLGIYYLHPLFSQNQYGSSCCCVISKECFETQIKSSPGYWWKGGNNEDIFINPPFDVHFRDAQQDGFPVILQLIPKNVSKENLEERPNIYKNIETKITEKKSESVLEYIKELEFINRTGFMREETYMLYSHKEISDQDERFKYCKTITRPFIDEVIELLNVSIVNASVSNENSSNIKLFNANPFYIHRNKEYKDQTFLHPNALAPLKIIETEDSFYLLYNYYNFNMETVFRFSNEMIDTELKMLMLSYQILRYLHFIHQQGLVHGYLSPSKLHLSDHCWLLISGLRCSLSIKDRQIDLINLEERENITKKWLSGEMSNFDYIIKLNEWAGRRHGDPNFHPIFPWVIDFKSSTSWRDLTKSKFRLTKGDEQLDTTYTSSKDNNKQNKSLKQKGSSTQYHINDILSELTYYNYFARKTPISILKKFVRTNYHANEYPASIERMYEWTPDESIPEFYSDESIFKSIHDDMPDLAVPDWCNGDVKTFLKMHREALESDYVSANLHHWIDITFGYKLSGEAGISAKNVALIDRTVPRNHGFVQLFTSPHPQKKIYTSFKTPSKIVLKNKEEVKKEIKKSMFGEQKEAIFQLFRTKLNNTEQTGDSNEGNEYPRNNDDDLIDMVEERDPTYFNSPETKKLLQNSFKEEIEIISGEYDHMSRSNTSFINDLVYTEMAEKFSISVENLEPIYYPPIDESIIHDPSFTDEERFEMQMSVDLFSAGCIIYQIFTKQPLFNKSTIKLFLSSDDKVWWKGPSSLISSYQIRVMIYSLLKQCKKYCTRDYKPGRQDQCQEVLRKILSCEEYYIDRETETISNINVFPIYFIPIYSFLCRYHTLTNWKEKAAHTLSYMSLLTSLPMQGFDIVLPFILNFFYTEETLAESLSFIEPVSIKLGPHKSNLILLNPLLSLYEKQDNEFLFTELVSIRCLTIIRQRLGLRTFLRHIIKYPIMAVRMKSKSISTQASHTLIELIDMLGVSVYMRYVLFPLILQVNKSNTSVLFETLIGIASYLDGYIISTHIVPNLLEIIQQQLKKGDPTSVDKAVSILKVVEKLIPMLSQQQVIQCLFISNNFFNNFIRTPLNHKALFLSVIDCLVTSMKILGASLLSKHIGKSIQYFFKTYEKSGKNVNGDFEINTDRMSYIIGTKLKDVLEITHEIDSTVSIGSVGFLKQETGKTLDEKVKVSEYRRVPQWMLTSMSLNVQNTQFSTTTIPKWSFQGNIIHSYKEHMNGIRSLAVDESERWFATGSKDNTVKIWDLLSDSSYCTYMNHKQAVFSLQFLDRNKAIASCDNSIHIWDIETKRRYYLLEHPSNFHSFCCNADEKIIIGGTGQSTIIHIDLRTKDDYLEWLLPSNQNSIPKSLCIYDYDQNLLAIGQSSGFITVIDIRTGVLLYNWKAHDGQVLDIKRYSDNPIRLVTSGVDKYINVWDVENFTENKKNIIAQFGGHQDPIIAFDIYKDELFSVSGTKISSAFLDQVGFVKLHKKKILKTSLKPNQLTTANVLYNQQLLLVGTEDGQVKVIQ